MRVTCDAALGNCKAVSSTSNVWWCGVVGGLCQWRGRGARYTVQSAEVAAGMCGAGWWVEGETCRRAPPPRPVAPVPYAARPRSDASRRPSCSAVSGALPLRTHARTAHDYDLAMACARGLCSAHNVFIFINIAFAMYSGALLATAARLAWDPSTYTWFRYLCEAQYRVSAGYVLAAGLWLAALVYLAASAPRRDSGASHASHASHASPLRLYCGGLVCLLISQVAYGAWMGASLAQWWRSAPQAELARRAMDLLHDLKPALLAVERYRDVARPLYDMIEEVEREAPNNAYVIIVFGLAALVLQVAALITAWRLSRRGGGTDADGRRPRPVHATDEDSDAADHDPPPGWRKKANLRMYTILDKIF